MLYLPNKHSCERRGKCAPSEPFLLITTIRPNSSVISTDFHIKRCLDFQIPMDFLGKMLKNKKRVKILYRDATFGANNNEFSANELFLFELTRSRIWLVERWHHVFLMQIKDYFSSPSRSQISLHRDPKIRRNRKTKILITLF